MWAVSNFRDRCSVNGSKNNVGITLRELHEACGTFARITVTITVTNTGSTPRLPVAPLSLMRFRWFTRLQLIN